MMHLDLPPKIRIDNGHIARRINNEGRIIGSRARHITWLHTYHKRALLTSDQFHAGYQLAYLWNKTSLVIGARTIRFNQLSGPYQVHLDNPLLPSMLREALKAVRSSKEKEAAIDLSVFDLCMGIRRMQDARDGLQVLAEHFKQARKQQS